MRRRDIGRSRIGRAADAHAPAPVLVVNSSARHMHVTQENLEILFGPGSKLQVHKWLYQEGQFASTATVTLVGPRDRIIPNLRILGPCRNLTQIELAYTDAVYLGIQVPVRMSGDIKGSSPGVIIGPKGVVELKEGIIRAARPYESFGRRFLRRQERRDDDAAGRGLQVFDPLR